MMAVVLSGALLVAREQILSAAPRTPGRSIDMDAPSKVSRLLAV